MMHTQCPECDLIFTPEKHDDEIMRLRAKNTRYRDVLEEIESKTFQWVMTKDNATDLLLVLRPIREKCREALKEE